MSKKSPAEALADLEGIKACLSYVEQELYEKKLGFAAHFVGAASCAIDGEIESLKRQHPFEVDLPREFTYPGLGRGEIRRPH